MLFYEFDGFIADKKWAEENDNRRVLNEKSRDIAMKSDEFNRKVQNQGFIYVSKILEDTVKLGILCYDPAFTDKWITPYLKAIDLDLKDISLKETTFEATRKMLQCSSWNDFIDDDDDVLEKFDLDALDYRYGRSMDFSEFVIDDADSKQVYKESEHFLADETLVPELDRIYAGGTSGRFMGHPVHYMLQTDDELTRSGMSKLLIQALYNNKRLQSRRYCLIEFSPDDSFSPAFYDALYKSSIGGAVVVGYLANDDTEDDHASCGREMIEALSKTMIKYRNQVLTIFCLPRECTESKRIFYESLGGTSFVELKEDFVSGEKAKNYLKMMTRGSGIRSDKKLLSAVEEEKSYLASELRGIFDEWYSYKLKSKIYPQYKEITSARKEVIEAPPKGTAYDELKEMIGLDEAKKVIDQALNYYKAQKLFAEKGMKTERPAMHMVFTGNPGTAKTSVARLFARIMKENDLLSVGKLIEVGRGDLVGKYVGWTAPTIQKKFREAKGSVLFIDEAYSLVDDRDGSFGDEAINTIVQEMENHREDVVVIFAGYPDKMESFLQKNPGLRSRIAFHVHFADYTTTELCDIAKLLAKQKGLSLTDEACAKLERDFDAVRAESDFGNGRYVRNVIEKAKMAQASRLISMDYDAIKTKDLSTICEEDIEETPIIHKPKMRRIGF